MMPTRVGLASVPSRIADSSLFAVGSVGFTVADVARHAAPGDRGSVRRPRTAREVEEAFRRGRHLLTGDQVAAWLAHWQIEHDDFRAWTQDEASDTEAATSWCHLVCSGTLEAAAARLASEAAAACELGLPPDSSDFEPADWVERLVDRACTPDALTGQVRRRRLDWTQVSVECVVTAERGPAEELRHRVLADSVDLAVAAGQAGFAVRSRTGTLADLEPPGLRPFLAGAGCTELIGPVRLGDRWALAEVLERWEPAADDVEVRLRAAAEVGAEAVRAAVARHVRG